MDSGYPNRAEPYAGQPTPVLSQALPPGSTPASVHSPAPAHPGYYGMPPADDRYRPSYGHIPSPGSYRGGPSRAGRSDESTIDQYGRDSRDVDRRSLSPPRRASYARGPPASYGPPDRSYRQPRGRSPLPVDPLPPTVKTPREQAAEEARIAARINAERVCRTLFVRNIKYTSNSAELRAKFERYGDVKNFFDLVSNRGMVFITYYDVRSATAAKQAMQGFNIQGRSIDTHYSLPRPDEAAGECGPDKNQGSLSIRAVGLRSPLDDGLLRQRLLQFGEISALFRPVGAPADERVVEFFDIRSTEDAHYNLQHAPFQEGTLVLEWVWDAAVPMVEDVPPVEAGPPAGYRDYPPPPREARRSPYGPPPSAYDGYGPPPRDYGPPPSRGYGPDRGYGPPLSSRDYGRPDDRYRDYPPGPPPRGDYYDDRSYRRPPPQEAYLGRGHRGYPPAPPPDSRSPPPQDRLDDARRVQALLSSLVPGTSGAPPAADGRAYAGPPPPDAQASRLPPAIQTLLGGQQPPAAGGPPAEGGNNVSQLLALLAQQSSTPQSQY